MAFIFRSRSLLAHSPKEVHFLSSGGICKTRFNDQESAAEAEKTASGQSEHDRYPAIAVRLRRADDSHRDGGRNEYADGDVQRRKASLKEPRPSHGKIQLTEQH